MTTDYHTTLSSSDGITISVINSRFSDLDSALGTALGSIPTTSVAMLYDSKATTTDGGSSTASTWVTRTLNQEIDSDSIVTLSSNQFTPISGTYLIMAMAPVITGGLSRLRLYNVTQASAQYVGLNNQTDTDETELATLYHIFTANGTDAYRLEHNVALTQATTGFGTAVSDGANEVYTMMLLIKVA